MSDSIMEMITDKKLLKSGYRPRPRLMVDSHIPFEVKLDRGYLSALLNRAHLTYHTQYGGLPQGQRPDYANWISDWLQPRVNRIGNDFGVGDLFIARSRRDGDMDPTNSFRFLTMKGLRDAADAKGGKILRGASPNAIPLELEPMEEDYDGFMIYYMPNEDQFYDQFKFDDMWEAKMRAEKEAMKNEGSEGDEE